MCFSDKRSLCDNTVVQLAISSLLCDDVFCQIDAPVSDFWHGNVKAWLSEQISLLATSFWVFGILLLEILFPDFVDHYLILVWIIIILSMTQSINHFWYLDASGALIETTIIIYEKICKICKKTSKSKPKKLYYLRTNNVSKELLTIVALN